MFYFVGFSVGKQNYTLKDNSKPNVFLFLFRKTWTDKANKKKTKCPLEGQKNSTMVKSRSMKYFILLWTNVLFCRILRGKKSYSLKATQNLTCFFFLFQKLERTSKQKKRNEMPTGRTKKKLHNGEIRVNEIFYSSLNKCSILSDSQWENKSYSLKATQNLTCFFFCFEKLEQTSKQKKKNEMPTRKTKKLHNGEIRVNEIFYSSLNKCSILSDSQTGKTKVTH